MVQIATVTALVCGLAGLATVSSSVPAACAVAAQTQTRPNIVLIMVDDMRNDDLRFMPQTRKLIRDQGVVFRNSFSPNPLCCPARASSLTGKYTHNHRVFDVFPPFAFHSFDDRSTIATWLRSAGYATIYLGKYLNQYGEQPPPRQDTGNSVRYVPPGWTDWRASIDGGLPPGHPKQGNTYAYDDTTISNNGSGFVNFAGRYQSRVYGGIIENVVRTRAPSDRPFFLYASFTAPHNGGPIEPDDPGWQRRSDGFRYFMGSPARPNDVKGMFDGTVKAAPGADWVDPDPGDKPEYLRRPTLNAGERAAVLELTRQRAEALWVVDRQVKRTIDALRAAGELNQTVVMFTSDNGYYLGEQRIRDGKVFPHEPSIRVPMLLRGPGIPRGQVRTDPFLSVDIAPTLTQFAGATPGAGIDGMSLATVARQGDRGWFRGVLTESKKMYGTTRDTDEAGGRLEPGETADIRYAIGVRTPRYLYVDLASGEEELYDVRQDPEQYHNLVNDRAHAEVLQALRQELAELRSCQMAGCRMPLPPLLR
jgi:arylsulfatase A-like enzyme